MELKDTYEKDVDSQWLAVGLSEQPDPGAIEREAHGSVREGPGVQPPGDYFLDAGCGSGDHLIRLARRGFRCVGVNISHHILEKAERAIEAGGLQSLVLVTCQPLEGLSFADGTFDHVHCRGVLMHIPDWEAALRQLVRGLKPGGRIVILEANRGGSFESHVVALVRRLTRRKSRLVETEGGLEFWAEVDGAPFVVRMADMKFLVGWLESHGLKLVERLATEFWDINRFRAGPIRNGSIHFNRLWFSLGLPASPCSGNALVAEKVAKS